MELTFSRAQSCLCLLLNCLEIRAGTEFTESFFTLGPEMEVVALLVLVVLSCHLSEEESFGFLRMPELGRVDLIQRLLGSISVGHTDELQTNS